MSYTKTAKDLAWDRERQKLKAEITLWQKRCATNQMKINEQSDTIKKQNEIIADLKEIVAELTADNTDPDDIVAKYRKQADLADMLGFMRGFPYL